MTSSLKPISQLAPGIGDELGTNTVDLQKVDEAPRHPRGALYKPGELGHTRGSSARAAAAE